MKRFRQWMALTVVVFSLAPPAQASLDLAADIFVHRSWRNLLPELMLFPVQPDLNHFVNAVIMRHGLRNYLVDDYEVESLVAAIDIDKFGKGICLGARGQFCHLAENIGQSLCYASRLSECSRVQNLGQAICLLSGAGDCREVQTFANGVCKASLGRFCPDTTVNLGVTVCGAASLGSERCRRVRSLGEGICLANNGLQCSPLDTLGKGICRAYRAQGCDLVETLSEGLCRTDGLQDCRQVLSLGQFACRFQPEPRSCEGTFTLSQGFCLASAHSSRCAPDTSFAEAVCLLGNGRNCGQRRSLGESVCRLVGGRTCHRV